MDATESVKMNQSKIIIELSEWEAGQMNIALQFLIDDYVKDIENFKEVPNDCLKAMSWLIAWKHRAFKDTSTDPLIPGHK